MRPVWEIGTGRGCDEYIFEEVPGASYYRLVLTFSAQTRTASLTRMAEEEFDVLVIGGGITGAGIALDAAARGLSVALVE